ncbi:hypothetical protein [Streptomyces sp. Rer75]|uniref:hypothetical protein n=1 Tax=unclassified Streptomyces TaxID=2593676 RepID=UPI0015D09E2B|nr:hypothetical protein [Streptomyces sp. Rer75]QLH23607.1 hypothetical protein HYQ63_25740 [Streptomyces sp. Rer75]
MTQRHHGVDCHPGVDRAAEFIFSAAHAPAASMKHQLQALFGLSVAEKAGTPGAVARVDAMAARVSGTLDRERENGRFDPFAHDVKLLLLCHDVLRRRGTESAALASFVRETSDALRGMEPVPARLTGLAHLLDAMGEGPFTMSETSGWTDGDPLPSGTSLLLADSHTVRRLCNAIAAYTLFGSREMPGRHPDLLLTLPVLVLQKLREYDLILGSTLLRALSYLGADDSETFDFAARYLGCQQQDDGRFGFYARELAEGPILRTADQDLFLPVAVSALWALAEVSVPGLQVVERL